MVQLTENVQCTGCMACEVSCAKGAITRKLDSLGNIYPEINSNLCIGCGKCRKVCPEQHPVEFHSPQKVFAVWSLDSESRKTSASGGAAAEFYGTALEEGYHICGAEYCSNGTVTHTLTTESDGIRRYKQSKYVYSEVASVYPEIRRLLDQGEYVLMISLPCKIAGLMGYLGKTYDNLLTVDIVCHGTPSAAMLQKHVEAVAHVSDNFRLNFRQDNLFLFHVSADGKVLYEKIGREDTYLAAFLEGLSYRDSCYQCAYARPERISDITICDFWGLGSEIPFDHPYTGAVSAVLLNTEKGKAFFEKAGSRMFAEERPVEEAVRGNAQLNAPTPLHPQREAFVLGCVEKGFEQTVSELLKDRIQAARQENRRNSLRSSLRAVAGIFMKRYRG